ncbi:hypothetical protein GIB67_015181 [Kingdonia uniflora]|uniref:SANT domain-containing protein n=1 Tax=Kingdonia uniflora TaxID=39325 RepID=A0A7J7LJ48_9MAGN|nr:hypothetical protein GIB67_015181 [Kingdonia uniflora]
MISVAHVTIKSSIKLSLSHTHRENDFVVLLFFLSLGSLRLPFSPLKPSLDFLVQILLFLINQMSSVEEDPYRFSNIENTSPDQLTSLDSSDVSDIMEDQQVLPRIGDEYQVEIPPLITELGLQLAKELNKDEVMVDVADSFPMGLPIPIMWVKDYALPGSLGKYWSDIEQESFLLGLYIFGKNLVQVKRFIGSKDIGDILYHYYGSFYRSEGHHRWSGCQKLKTTKCIYGERIFTGRSQQVLLSRLLPPLSEECQKSLQEVSKTFGEGEISLEEYVLTLKATVGISSLIEAVGVGKGKQDLTGIIVDSAKAVQVRSRLKIPVGKECSSLTYEDIIKFISGDVRLSKARSNDMFWEAVWPRLLAKDWHSEQPKNHSYAYPKHSLVFLIPGIEKFSRRRLVKGNDYFDSVTEVLNKVASNPRLIELGNEEYKVTEENGWGTESKLNKYVDHSKDQRRSYLQPRTSNRNSDLMSFTIIDTSLDPEEETNTVRTLRSLPVETATNRSAPTSLSRETDGFGEEPVGELDTSNMLLNDEVDTIISNPSERMDEAFLPDCMVDVLKNEMPVGPDLTTAEVDNNKDQDYASISENHPAKIITCQFKRRAKPSSLNYLSPSTKRRRLTACHAESSGTTNHYSPDANENIFSEVGPSHDKVSTGSSQSNADEIIEGQPQPRTLIDLNLPHVPLDYETYESLITEVADESSFLPEPTQQLLPGDFEPAIDMASGENHSVNMARRQGTRNRPLTAKALEALACEFLVPKPKRRRRGKGAMPLESSLERPFRRRRGRVGTATVEIVDSNVEERLNEECSSNFNWVASPRSLD